MKGWAPLLIFIATINSELCCLGPFQPGQNGILAGTRAELPLATKHKSACAKGLSGQNRLQQHRERLFSFLALFGYAEFNTQANAGC